MVNQSVGSPFPNQIGQGAQKAADEAGVTMVQIDANSDEQKMSAGVQDLISQGVDGILLVPFNPSISGLVQDAHTAGIPIAATHNFVGTSPDDLDPNLAFALLEDERGSATKAAQMAVQALPNGGKVAIILGAPGYSEDTYRVENFKSALQTAGNFTIVGEQPGNWTAQDGQSACANLLAANPDLSLIYSISDDMAVGCVEAVKAVNSKALIIGVGGEKVGITQIQAGAMYGTVCYKPYDEGYAAMKQLIQVITTGQNPDPRTIYYDTPAITKDNVSQCDPQW